MQLVCRCAFFQTFKSRITHNFTLLTWHIDHPKMYNLTSHFSYDISHFKSLVYIYSYILFISCCVKWITNHNSQLPNVICETDMKREYNFWKNALQCKHPITKGDLQIWSEGRYLHEDEWKKSVRYFCPKAVCLHGKMPQVKNVRIAVLKKAT